MNLKKDVGLWFKYFFKREERWKMPGVGWYHLCQPHYPTPAGPQNHTYVKARDSLMAYMYWIIKIINSKASNDNSEVLCP